MTELLCVRESTRKIGVVSLRYLLRAMAARRSREKRASKSVPLPIVRPLGPRHSSAAHVFEAKIPAKRTNAQHAFSSSTKKKRAAGSFRAKFFNRRLPESDTGMDRPGGKAVKWKRSLLRLWLLSSALWIATVLAIAVRNETGRVPGTTVHVKYSNTETWDYPVEWGEKRIRADLEERVAAKNAEERKWVAELPEDRKAACRDFPKNSPSIVPPDDCERLFVATHSELVAPTGWEAQLPQPVWTTTLLLWALGPTAAVFLLGAGLIWVVQGFRPEP